ncbi:MAG: hypothetical protein K2L34_00660 [Muribaculaceae bacterium]|nr:hypothetical protein [Muribaculaceae bacterium]
MKRFQLLITIVVLLCGMSGVVRAEDTDTRPMWGVKAAVDLNLPGKWRSDDYSIKMYRHGFGVNVGVVCNVYLGKDFYFEPGVSLFYDTYSYYKFVVSGEGGNIVESDPSLYKVGLRVPVIFGRMFDFSEKFAMTVFTGPEISYAFAGGINAKNKEIFGEGGLKLFGKEHGCQRRVDCAWKAGIGFPTGDWYVSLDVAFGLTDMLKGDISFYENRCSLGVTRYF